MNKEGVLRQAVVFPDLLAVRFVDRHGRQCDLFLHLFAFDDLQSLANALRSRCRIEESRGEIAFANPSGRFVWQRIDSEKLDVLFPASIFGREVRAIRDRVIMTVNQIDLVELLESGRHRVVALRLLPVAVDGLKQRLNARLFANELIETVVSIVSGLRSHSTPQLDNIAFRSSWSAEQLDRVFASRFADYHVIAADELRVLVGIDVPVEDDHRNFCVNSFEDDTG